MGPKKHITCYLAVVALAGCTTISERAATVQFHTQLSNALDGCTRIAPVTVTVSRFALRQDDEISVALREAAANTGGDTVVALNRDETISEIIQHGISYKCYAQ